MKKIIFCDIDGTIIDGSRGMLKISDKTKYAVEQLKKDNYFFIASGRCKALLNQDIIDLNPSGFVLCNGAYTEYNKQMIHQDYLSNTAVQRVKEIVDKYDGFYILETLNDLFINSTESEAFKLFTDGWGSALKKHQSNSDEDDAYCIAMIGFKNEDICIKVQEELKDYVKATKHNFSSSFDINSIGIDKGYGVKKVIEYLNIPIEDTYCFGDGLNDIEMLQAVGHPVIMANSDNSLKKYDFEETDDVLEDGFYNYLVKNKLIKEL